MYDVVIVGAGASGIMCASFIKEHNHNLNVLILEKNDKLGKKLLATGNGRCNLGNADMNINNFFSNDNLDRFEKVLKANIFEGELLFDDGYFDNYLEYMKRIGVLIKSDENRLYPYSNQAITVCKAFEKYLSYLDVEIKYNYDVKEIIKEDSEYIIDNEIKSKTVIIATGGKSYPKTGSTGQGYEILKSFGHKIENTYPSLTYLKTNYKYIKELAGVRHNCVVNLSVDGQIIDYEEGQVQFTKEALSGICVFNLSRNVSRYILENKKVRLILNLVPEYSAFELENYLKKFYEYKIEEVLSNVLNNKLAFVVTKELNIFGKKVKELTKNELDGILFNLHNLYFKITDVGDFSVSQVTAGGASLSCFTTDLESKKQEGLYAIGEVLDVDGKCGGYNLCWAFTSALIVAKSILKNFVVKK